MGYELSNGKFRNEASRRFYHFYTSRFESNELDRDIVAADFDFGRTHKYEYWKHLKEGKTSVKLEHLLIGKEKHKLNLLWIFGYSEKQDLPDFSLMAPGYIEEGDTEYQVTYSPTNVGSVIDRLLDKHQIHRKQYAEDELQMTPRNLQRIIKGDVNPYFITVAKIAEDLGEPLDVFRSKPLPQGHLLEIIKEKDDRIQEQAHTIEALLKALGKHSPFK